MRVFPKICSSPPCLLQSFPKDLDALLDAGFDFKLYFFIVFLAGDPEERYCSGMLAMPSFVTDFCSVDERKAGWIADEARYRWFLKPGKKVTVARPIGFEKATYNVSTLVMNSAFLPPCLFQDVMVHQERRKFYEQVSGVKNCGQIALKPPCLDSSCCLGSLGCFFAWVRACGVAICSGS